MEAAARRDRVHAWLERGERDRPVIRRQYYAPLASTSGNGDTADELYDNVRLARASTASSRSSSTTHNRPPTPPLRTQCSWQHCRRLEELLRKQQQQQWSTPASRSGAASASAGRVDPVAAVAQSLALAAATAALPSLATVPDDGRCKQRPLPHVSSTPVATSSNAAMGGGGGGCAPAAAFDGGGTGTAASHRASAAAAVAGPFDYVDATPTSADDHAAGGVFEHGASVDHLGNDRKIMMSSEYVQPAALAPLASPGDMSAPEASASATGGVADYGHPPCHQRAHGAGDPFNIVTINVAGMRFQTHLETLERFPDTLLGHPLKRAPYYNPATGEYFFDRHRTVFEAILYIYQSDGRVKRPDSVPTDIFLQELKFFDVGPKLLEAFWISEGYVKPEEPPLPENRIQRELWKVIEHPDTSLCARIVAFVSVFVIITSIVNFCVETVPEMKYVYNSTDGEPAPKVDWGNPFFCVEVLCITWFTIEFVLRFGTCPQKCDFIKSFLNIIDVVAIVPFFINLFFIEGEGGGGMQFAVLRVLRLVRVFRIFKLSRHSVGLQILGKTFSASVQEFCLLIFFLVIALVLFASGMYFAEGGGTVKTTKFTSIPASFWYAIVTMTTVGYGDMYPEATAGKLVGSCCALIGVLTLALPVPIIVANFKHFYRQETRLAQMRANEDFQEDAESGSSD